MPTTTTSNSAAGGVGLPIKKSRSDLFLFQYMHEEEVSFLFFCQSVTTVTGAPASKFILYWPINLRMSAHVIVG